MIERCASSLWHSSRLRGLLLIEKAMMLISNGGSITTLRGFIHSWLASTTSTQSTDCSTRELLSYYSEWYKNGQVNDNARYVCGEIQEAMRLKSKKYQTPTILLLLFVLAGLVLVVLDSSVATSTWVYVSLGAATLSGVRHFFRFRTALRVQELQHVSLLSTAVTLLLGSGALLVWQRPSPNLGLLVVYSIVAGVAYPLVAILGHRAQHYLKNFELFQALTHNGNLIAIPLLLFFFSERPTIGQWVTICGTFSILLLLGTKSGKYNSKATVFVIGTATAYAVLTLINKLVTGSGPLAVDPLYFLVTSNIAAACFGIYGILSKRDRARMSVRILCYGGIAGVLNAATFGCILIAYVLGNDHAATVTAILSASVFIASTLNTAFPGELGQERNTTRIIISAIVFCTWSLGVVYLSGR